MNSLPKIGRYYRLKQSKDDEGLECGWGQIYKSDSGTWECDHESSVIPGECNMLCELLWLTKNLCRRIFGLWKTSCY